jgi:hypothetical protein
MQDRELIRMAAFKLQEAARRLASLARESDSVDIRRHLRALADELLAQEKRLWQLHEPGAPQAATTGQSDRAGWSGRARRRAVG